LLAGGLDRKSIDVDTHAMTDSSSNVIPPEFSFLRDERGFRIEAYAGGPNGAAHLVNGDLRISLLHDRGAFHVLVGSVKDEPGPGNWYTTYGLHIVRSFVLQTDPGEEPSDAQLADFLRTHLPAVKTMFSADNLPATKAALEEIGIERAKKLFPGSIIVTDSRVK
jgi:hypothetical protein